MKILTVIIFFFSFLVVPLEAETPQLTKTEHSDEFFNSVASSGTDFNYASEFANMLITLGILLGLIFISVWGLKRLLRSRAKQLNTSKGIKILERRNLNQKSSLYVVEVLGKGLVIGESQAGIHLITEFPQETDLETLIENETSPTPTKNLFSSLLKWKWNKSVEDGERSSS